MEPFLSLMALCVTMFFGSFGFGYIPLMFSLDRSKLKFLSIFGAGLLVGTALVVIIPEGIHTLYSDHDHSADSLHDHSGSGVDVGHDAVLASAGQERSKSITLMESDPSDLAVVDLTDDDHSHSHAGGEESAVTVCQHVDQKSIGLALALGFLFMLLVDRASGGAHPHLDAHGHGHGHAHAESHSLSGGGKSRMSHSHSPSGPAGTSNSPVPRRDLRRAQNNNGGGGGSTEEELELLGVDHHHRSGSSPLRTALSGGDMKESTTIAVNTLSDLELNASSAKPKFSSATIGLVVHSAFDGVALGAAARNPSTGVELLIFFALMLHKAPSAFALAVFLLDQGRPKFEVAKHLFLFAFMAPFCAILTYFLLGSNADPASSNENLGFALLFSAGTFLYLSTVHMIPELAPGGHLPDMSWSHIAGLCLGIIVPGIINIEHEH